MPLSCHRRYLLVANGVLCLLVAVVALINRAANPYSLFAHDWISVPTKPEMFTHLRLVKAAQVRHLRPQALILGSSRTETGLSPNHPSWSAHPVYNLGLSEAGIYEIQRYFQHACALAPVKQAVILLDYSAFMSGAIPAPDFREDRLAASADGRQNTRLSWFDYVTALTSWDALMGSLATLTGRAGEKSYLPDGSRDQKAEDERIVLKGGAAKAFAACDQRVFATLVNIAPVIDESAIASLQTIMSTARAYGIDLRFGIAPMHAHYLEMLDMTEQWQTYESWKVRLTEVIEAEAACSRAQPFILADFSGYNTFTNEDVPASGLARYYYETSHFTKNLGNELLSRLLAPRPQIASTAPGSFGFLISTANITTHLESIRQSRQAYRDSHRAELELLKSRQPPLPNADKGLHND